VLATLTDQNRPRSVGASPDLTIISVPMMGVGEGSRALVGVVSVEGLERRRPPVPRPSSQLFRARLHVIDIEPLTTED
jgi:hypothetical protein